MYTISGGYYDNSFRIFRNGKLIKIIEFHKKTVDIILFEESTNKLIIASRDHRISVWNVEFKEKMVELVLPPRTFYGHQNDIIDLSVSSQLMKIVSCDLDGVIYINSLTKNKMDNFLCLKL